MPHRAAGDECELLLCFSGWRGTMRPASKPDFSAGLTSSVRAKGLSKHDMLPYQADSLHPYNCCRKIQMTGGKRWEGPSETLRLK